MQEQTRLMADALSLSRDVAFMNEAHRCFAAMVSCCNRLLDLLAENEQTHKETIEWVQAVHKAAVGKDSIAVEWLARHETELHEVMNRLGL